MNRAEWMRSLGTLGILAIAIVRCTVMFAPVVVFDTDPMFDHTPFTGLGPVGSMMLDVLLLFVCAVTLIGEWCSGRSIRWPIMTLALLPLPVVIWHGLNDAGNLWLGSTWQSAAIACATLAHVSRDPKWRTLVFCILIAATLPLIARGVVQVVYEHPNMIRAFEEQRDQILRDRGWAPDSPSAQIYERRLRQPQPLAWFATTNIFASLVGVACIAWIGLGWAAWRARMESGWTGTMILCALAAGIMLVFTGSKGAGLTIVIALFVMVALSRTTLACRFARLLPFAALALIACTLIGVVIRGTMLPEDFLNDRSLLYRWHYLVSSSRIFADHMLLGTGPDGFQAAYTLHRLPRNPEEVTSAHSAFVDWLCTLGVLGIAWGMLAISRLWRTAQSIERACADPDTATEFISARMLWLSVAGIITLGFIPALAIEFAAIDGVGLMSRILALLAFSAAAIVSVRIVERSSPIILAVTSFVAIAMLMMHAQIEMTLTQPSAVLWVMCLLGTAGASVSNSFAARFNGIRTMLICLIIFTFGVFILLRGVIPANRQQQLMFDAAALLQRTSLRSDGPTLASSSRQQAADQLVLAHEHWPSNVTPLEAAARQLILATEGQTETQQVDFLHRAAAILDRALETHTSGSIMTAAINVRAQLATMTRNESDWQRAIALARVMSQRDPNGISSWKRLGDVLWAYGSHSQARDAYRRALQANDQFELDRLKQLPTRDLKILQERLNTASEE